MKEKALRRFVFKTGHGGELPGLHVVGFEGCEHYNALFEFRIVLAASDRAAIVAMGDALSKPATLSILSLDGRVRREFHGILRGIHQLHRRNDLTYYEAVLVPQAWLLGETQGSYVFVDKSFDAILETVLKRAALNARHYKFSLKNVYKPRDLVMQYNESDLGFINRWMEFYGIYYYFDHTNGHDRLMITDTLSTLSKMPHGGGIVHYDPVNGLQSVDADSKIQNFTVEKRRLPARARLKNYSSNRPDLELSATAEVWREGHGEVCLYGQSFSTIEDGRALARIRAEEMRCRGEIYRGDATSPFLCVGQYFTLKDHHHKRLNGDYQVTAITHHANQSQFLQESGLPVERNETLPGGGGYHCHFEAIARQTQFRPRRKTPVPVFPGTITGHIDGVQDGKYAELNDSGHYKVRLPFDDGDTEKGPGKASCWLRMTQPYGGENRGMHFPLIKGTEVLLTAIDGNLDRLVICQVVPNRLHPGPVGAANQTKNSIVTGGGNRIEMEDEDGRQHILIASPSGNSYLRIGGVSPGRKRSSDR
ncbi:MAG: type VI secretion system tip protein TssI/VgrG [Hyphomicrobiales bacterium]